MAPRYGIRPAHVPSSRSALLRQEGPSQEGAARGPRRSLRREGAIIVRVVSKSLRCLERPSRGFKKPSRSFKRPAGSNKRHARSASSPPFVSSKPARWNLRPSVFLETASLASVVRHDREIKRAEPSLVPARRWTRAARTDPREARSRSEERRVG